MGRRKIEIQPITHERNRSVTFLKRKNGLFKKAYELGVLCSVDVAVIIFEARPGHEVKLHEYSSSDIRSIVQRQTRHQGDTDLKVPADFSGSAAKFDDGGDADGDDDNVDEEEDLPAAKPSGRRRGQGRLTLPTNADDYIVQLPPPPPPAHHLHPESGAAALLSVANDRVSNMRDLHPPSRPNKRTRNARSRSPSEDAMIPALPAINSEWGLPQDNQGIGRYGRNIRHLQNPPSPGLPQQQQQEHQHSQQYHSMHPQQQQHPGHGFQYTPLFPVSNQVSPPPAFIPLHHDFGSSRGLPGFTSRPGGSGSGPEGGSGYNDLHQRMRPSDSPGYNPAPYPPNANSMTRHSDHHHQQTLLSQPPPSPPAFHAQPPAAAAHRREDRDGLFGNLLEADERSRQRAGSGTVTGGSGAGLDWPMHDGLAPPERSAPSGAGGAGGPRSSVEGPGMPNPSNGSDWFDFLSRSNTINEVQASSGRRSSWPKNSNNMDGRQNKNGDDIGNPYDVRKESAVRGQSGEDVPSQGEADLDIPILTSPEERIGEGDAGNANKEDARSDADKTEV